MRPDREFVPLFGCMPHTPDRAYPELTRFARGKGKKSIPATCRTCGGVQPEGSPFVCAGCHGVAPEAEAHFGSAKVEAIAGREPARNLVRRAIADALENTGRSVLSPEERAELVADHGDVAVAWLDSIGQPAAPLEAAA